MQSSVSTSSEIVERYTIAVNALCEIARSYYYLGRLADAQHTFHTSLHLLEIGTIRPPLRLKLLLEYSKMLIVDHLLTHKNGDLLFSTISQAKRLTEETNDQLSMADALCLLGQAHYFTTIMASLDSGKSPDSPQEQGKFDEAMTYQQQALKLRETLHDTRGMSESHFQIGSVYERWQQYTTAQEHYIQAQQIAVQYDHLFEKIEPARHLALLALIKGDLDRAIASALQALSLREAAGFKPYLPLDHLLLSTIYQARGAATNAQLHLQQARAIAEEMGYPSLVSSVPDLEALQKAQ
jgi:tetratricopeptide (TPR) repeat protein